MKILKIENENGKKVPYFRDFTADSEKYELIENLNDKQLLELVGYVMNKDDAEIDQAAEGDLPNPVQQTIYDSVSKKLTTLLTSKSTIIAEVQSKFKEAEEKYK